MVVNVQEKGTGNAKPKILFIHHAPMWYRRPFFHYLGQMYPVEFLFTNVEEYNRLYDTELSGDLPGMEGVKYQAVPKKLGIAWGAINRTLGDYDVFVGGSWDTPADVIETFFYLIILKLKRKPFILWREDWDWNVNSIKRKLVKSFAGFIARRADALLVPSYKHGEFFTKMNVSPEKIFIMPNVSNIEIGEMDFKNEERIRKELGLLNKKIVLFVGRLFDLKGVQYLLPGFKKLTQKMDEAVLLIVGGGECQEELEKMAHELELTDLNIDDETNKVIFTGNIENELLGAYYLLANIFVLPSITTYFADACPLVVNEAMYFGKPVITSDAVGTTFMIEEGENGFVVPERDPDALFRAMDTILSHPEMEKKMGKRSKEIIEEGFQYKNMIDGFQKALKHVQDNIK